MTNSQTISKVLAGIANVSQDMSPVTKNASNPHFKNQYATLDAIQEALQPILARHKIGVSQPLMGKGILTIVTDIESGEWIAFPSEIDMTNLKPQDQMSGVTYMKRYALIGTFNIIVENEDDDGNAASKSDRVIDYPEPPKTIRR